MAFNSRKYYGAVGVMGESSSDISRFEKTLPHLLEGVPLLDVGTGEGFFQEFLDGRLNAKVTSVDISYVRLREAIAKKRVFSGVIADATSPPFINEEFEQVTALETLEHIPDWKTAMKELFRVAGKRLIVTVPFDQRIGYEQCPSCGHSTPYSGHFHRFSEIAFRNLSLDGALTFEYFYPPHRLGHYFFRGAKALIQESTSQNRPERKNEAVCVSCFSKVAYTHRWRKRFYRLVDVAMHKPYYLLVRVDKL